MELEWFCSPGTRSEMFDLEGTGDVTRDGNSLPGAGAAVHAHVGLLAPPPSLSCHATLSQTALSLPHLFIHQSTYPPTPIVTRLLAHLPTHYTLSLYSFPSCLPLTPLSLPRNYFVLIFPIGGFARLYEAQRSEVKRYFHHSLCTNKHTEVYHTNHPNLGCIEPVSSEREHCIPVVDAVSLSYFYLLVRAVRLICKRTVGQDKKAASSFK